MAPTNIKTVHPTFLLHIESNLDRLGLLSSTPRRLSGLVGNLAHLLEFDSCQSRIFVMASVAETVSTWVSKIKSLVDEL